VKGSRLRKAARKRIVALSALGKAAPKRIVAVSAPVGPAVLTWAVSFYAPGSLARSPVCSARTLRRPLSSRSGWDRRSTAPGCTPST
jgi:hypothetical protein